MDPLALLPYALAAAGGRVDSHDVTALVAAGVTLLQRSAPLVRAMAGRRSATLLAPGPAWVVALAASDGRGMVVLDRHEPISAASLDALLVGAVFTTSAAAPAVPAGVPIVLLDEAPHRARVIVGDRDATVDLGSHYGLELIGDSGGMGSPEECLRFAHTGHAHSHAEVLENSRATMATRQFTPLHHTVCAADWRDLTSLSETLLAPLLAGASVTTTSP